MTSLNVTWRPDLIWPGAKIFTQDAQRLNNQLCQIWRRCAPPFFLLSAKNRWGGTYVPPGRARVKTAWTENYGAHNSRQRNAKPSYTTRGHRRTHGRTHTRTLKACAGHRAVARPWVAPPERRRPPLLTGGLARRSCTQTRHVRSVPRATSATASVLRDTCHVRGAAHGRPSRTEAGHHCTGATSATLPVHFSALLLLKKEKMGVNLGENRVNPVRGSF